MSEFENLIAKLLSLRPSDDTERYQWVVRGVFTDKNVPGGRMHAVLGVFSDQHHATEHQRLLLAKFNYPYLTFQVEPMFNFIEFVVSDSQSTYVSQDDKLNESDAAHKSRDAEAAAKQAAVESVLCSTDTTPPAGSLASVARLVYLCYKNSAKVDTYTADTTRAKEAYTSNVADLKANMGGVSRSAWVEYVKPMLADAGDTHTLPAMSAWWDAHVEEVADTMRTPPKVISPTRLITGPATSLAKSALRLAASTYSSISSASRSEGQRAVFGDNASEYGSSVESSPQRGSYVASAPSTVQRPSSSDMMRRRESVAASPPKKQPESSTTSGGTTPQKSLFTSISEMVGGTQQRRTSVSRPTTPPPPDKSAITSQPSTPIASRMSSQPSTPTMSSLSNTPLTSRLPSTFGTPTMSRMSSPIKSALGASPTKVSPVTPPKAVDFSSFTDSIPPRGADDAKKPIQRRYESLLVDSPPSPSRVSAAAAARAANTGGT